MSMTPYTLDQLRDLLPGYLFGTLDTDELSAFEQGLRSPVFGASLQSELSALRSTAGAVAQAHAVTPPPSLRDRLQARIAAEKAAMSAEPSPAASTQFVQPAQPAMAPGADVRVAETRDAGARISEARVTRATPSSRAVRVTPPGTMAMPQTDEFERRRMTRPPSRAGWYSAAVFAAGLAATAVFAFDLRSQLNALEAEARNTSLRLARTNETLSEKEKTLATLLAGRGNVVLVTLDATAPTGPGMQVFWNVRDGRAVMNAYGLAQVPSNRAYMLWMIRDGTPVPLKLFTPDESGRALVADVEVPNSTTGITLLAVTEEDAAGATAPTMTPFIAGAVPVAR